MKAQVLHAPQPIAKMPLRVEERELPPPGAGEGKAKEAA